MKATHFKRLRRHEHGSLNELNITPLLDLVFVLLVIFIITTPQLTNSLEINLPSGKPPPVKPAAKPVIHRIRVDEKGQAFLNGEALAVPALKAKLQALKSVEPDPHVEVKANDEAQYQNIVDVLDTLQQLQINKVGLATDPQQL